jgi:uncharacterized protein YjiK
MAILRRVGRAFDPARWAFVVLWTAPLPHASSTLAHYRLDEPPASHVELPHELDEISGLALSPDGRLFAQGDERGIIWQLDPRTGRILKRFALAVGPTMQPYMGKRPKPDVVTGDFEDIHIVGERFFLLSSNGLLVEFREGRDGDRVPWRAFDTGLSRSCELEGLTYDESTHSLLLLCKHAYPKAWHRRIVVLGWSIDTGRLDPKPRLLIPESRVAQVTRVAEFHGSALAIAPESGNLILIAGPQRRIIEISPTGEVVAGRALKSKLHRQPEGLAFESDRTMLISDEAAGARPTLTAYAYRP